MSNALVDFKFNEDYIFANILSDYYMYFRYEKWVLNDFVRLAEHNKFLGCIN